MERVLCFTCLGAYLFLTALGNNLAFLFAMTLERAEEPHLSTAEMMLRVNTTPKPIHKEYIVVKDAVLELQDVILHSPDVDETVLLKHLSKCSLIARSPPRFLILAKLSGLRYVIPPATSGLTENLQRNASDVKSLRTVDIDVLRQNDLTEACATGLTDRSS